MAKGSCLCGAVSFELDKEGVVLAVGCYCSNCRKVSGGQYGVYLQVRPRNFRWLSGEHEVATYESSPGNKRGFCTTCGSVAPIATSYGAIRVPGGALDEDPGVSIDTIIHSTGRTAWCEMDKASNVFPDSGPEDFWRKAIIRLYTG